MAAKAVAICTYSTHDAMLGRMTLKQRAVRMRERGKSYPQISQQLKVAPSYAWYLVNGLPRSTPQTRERHAQWAERRLADKQRDGVCTQCTLVAVQGERLCKRHKRMAQARRNERHAAGICVDCKRPSIVGQWRCAAHLQLNIDRKQRANKRRANGYRKQKTI